MSFSLVGVAIAATPYTSATVTKVENRVGYGERTNPNRTRPAAPRDVVRENNFLLSKTASRAELEYPDGSVVRIGQNTVFSFDSDTRTLELKEGSLLFYVPKGSGGGKIKTPSLTAAITGTAGKVSENYIAIVEGVVRLEPSGRLVREGEFARRNADGTITIGRFDPATATAGQLVNFNGVMPGFQERDLAGLGRDLPYPDLRQFEVLQRTQNLPSAIDQHFPPPPDPKPEVDRPRRQVVVPPPRNDPAPRPRPGNGGEY
ncbi:MAG: FecR domain-containing protein [Chthoniobacteraceae bacterium]